MKANRKAFNNDEEAVSPVIAVILMVAITVVLAATVFVLVNELGQDIGETGPNLGLSTAGTATDSDQWTIRVTSATEGAAFSEYTYTLTAGGSTYTNASWGTDTDVSGVTFDTGSDCYRLRLVTSGSELSVGERLQLEYATGYADCNELDNVAWDSTADIPNETHELELIHRPTSTSSGTISRNF